MAPIGLICKIQNICITTIALLLMYRYKLPCNDGAVDFLKRKQTFGQILISVCIMKFLTLKMWDIEAVMNLMGIRSGVGLCRMLQMQVTGPVFGLAEKDDHT